MQLAIIMVGKQAFGAVIEMSKPFFMRLYNKWKYTANIETNSTGELNLPQWEEDFVLESWGPTSLFYEYLELVIQFGFVTIFVCAFPLAPLFALINNFFEIRLDAKKFITSFKRPVAQRFVSNTPYPIYIG
jgi:anoctamin-1